MQISQLPYEQEICPYVMESTPDIISIGYRTKVLGYAYFMLPYSNKAMLIAPSTSPVDWQLEVNTMFNRMYNGDVPPIMTLHLEDHVPYMLEPDEKTRHVSCPGASVSVDGPPAQAAAVMPAEQELDVLPAQAAAIPEAEEDPPPPAPFEGEGAGPGLITQETKERRLRKEAMSLHHLMTHETKNPYCECCIRSKPQRKPRKKGKPRPWPST